MSNKRSDQVFGGAILIGMGILFILGNYWWPGVLFVLGIAMMLRTITEGKNWSDDRGALALLVMGVFFSIQDVLRLGNNWLPIALSGVGLYMLFGNNLRGSIRRDQSGAEKSKNEFL